MDPVDVAIREQFNNLSSSDVTAARSNVCRMKKRGKLRCGTFFSGAELFYLIILAVNHSMLQTLGLALQADLAWAAEKDEWKRDFYSVRSGPKMSFGDVIRIVKNDFRGMNYLTGEECELETVDFFAAGFECDTVCKIVKNAGAKDCMELMEGKTGQTGRATLLTIAKFKYKVSLLENSSVLGERNIKYICEYLNVFGLLVVPVMVKAEEYGSGSRRERQYLLVVLIAHDQIDQFAKDFERPACIDRFLVALKDMQIGPGNVDDFLFDKDSSPAQDFVETMYEHRTQLNDKKIDKKPGKKTEKVGGKGEKEKDDELNWEADHLELFRKAGLQWPPDMKADDEELAFQTGFLIRRMQEAAYWHTHRPREGANNQSARTFHDLHPTLKFQSEVTGCTNTIVCTSVLYDRIRKRVLSGAELLLLQGYPKSALFQEGLPSNAHCTELAGNAMNGFCIAAIYQALLVSGIFLYEVPEDTKAKAGTESEEVEVDSEYEEVEVEEGGEEETAVTMSDMDIEED